MALVVLVRSSIRSGARQSGVAFFAALLMLVLAWTGTRGLESARGSIEADASQVSQVSHSRHADTAERGALGSLPDGKPISFDSSSEAKEKELDESGPSVALCTDPDGARVTVGGRALGEAAGTAKVHNRRLIACIGARGPPIV
jgi:hypothetical protein